MFKDTCLVALKRKDWSPCIIDLEILVYFGLESLHMLNLGSLHTFNLGSLRMTASK
jgi:hypothetical protein